MATSTLVPLSEYLQTSYRPDRDWIDGEVKERNMGEGPHAAIQAYFIGLFRQHRMEWGVRVLPEQRVQTSAEHYRIPDVCIVRRTDPFELIVQTPPLLCIEILSRDDRMSEMQERVDDYLGMGAEMVWLVDPRRRKAFMTHTQGLEAATEELSVPGTSIRIPVPEIFLELDELEGKS